MKKPQAKIDGWYARKPYAHFDVPLGYGDAKTFVSDPDSVTKHGFHPFLAYTDKKRRFSTVRDPVTRKAVRDANNRRVVEVKSKSRHLMYCSHIDGYIHAFYAKMLNDAYELALKSEAFSPSVLGYRRGLGTNIELAFDAFVEIKARGDCLAVCHDISDFFGSVNHAVLKKNLALVLGTPSLASDWYQVYRSMTHYAWVECDNLEERLGVKMKDFKRPICDAKTFRNKVRQKPTIIKTNGKPHGIPQGSPISAILSNIYMFKFDNMMHHGMVNIGGSYRRYSDDILLIIPPAEEKAAAGILSVALASLGPSIEINTDKSERCLFTSKSAATLLCDNPLTYLGFTFDGCNVRMRDRTVSRYFRRMTYATRGATRAAKNTKSSVVYKRKLIRDFTHLGSQNLYSYARRAVHVMGDTTPTRQLRRHMTVLMRKIRSGK